MNYFHHCAIFIHFYIWKIRKPGFLLLFLVLGAATGRAFVQLGATVPKVTFISS